jgi:hypothetical protein
MNSKVLTIVISYFDKPWNLRMFIENWIFIAQSHKEDIEIFILDNSSEFELSAKKLLEGVELPVNIKLIQNSVNVGMLGNLFVGSYLGSANYIWFIGDDDYVISSNIQKILCEVKKSEFDIINLNYDLNNHQIKDKIPIEEYLKFSIRLESNNYLLKGSAIELAAVTENFYTGIYSAILRRSIAVKAYKCFSPELFKSIKGCVPLTHYILKEKAQFIKTLFIEDKSVVANINSSWHEYLLAWSVARIPEVHLQFLDAGTPETAVLKWIKNHDNTLKSGLEKLSELSAEEKEKFLLKYRVDLQAIDLYKQYIEK